MNWHQITRFNFTWALPGGAWLEDSARVPELAAGGTLASFGCRMR